MVWCSFPKCTLDPENVRSIVSAVAKPRDRVSRRWRYTTPAGHRDPARLAIIDGTSPMPDLHLQLADDETGPGTRAPAPIDDASAILLLQRAEMTGQTLVPWGSNYTFAVALHDPESDEV